MTTLKSHLSMEFISVGAKTLLPVEILRVVESYRAILKERDLTEADAKVLSDVVAKHTNLNISMKFVGSGFGFGIYCPTFRGHSGVSARSGQVRTEWDFPSEHGKYLEGRIDLDKVKVHGSFTKIEFLMLLPPPAFSEHSTATPEELTAFILHEIGHAFFVLGTLGEYVWFNYFLTDGVDVVLGKKSNTYKVKLLTPSYLSKHVDDPELKENLLKAPTEAHVRKAILTITGLDPRNHLGSYVGMGAVKRDEQLADMFVSRLGYGRALITGLDKIFKSDPSARRAYASKLERTMIIVSRIAIATATMAMPLVWLTYAGFHTMAALGAYSNVYDNPQERFLKVRRDLVNQLKRSGLTPNEREILLADIKTADGFIDGMNQASALLEDIFQLVNFGLRRKRTSLRGEERLEQLLNNDLFVTAAQLKSRSTV